MRIEIIKCNDSDPALQQYVGRVYEAEFMRVDNGKDHYRLKDGSCWLPEEVEGVGESKWQTS